MAGEVETGADTTAAEADTSADRTQTVEGQTTQTPDPAASQRAADVSSSQPGDADLIRDSFFFHQLAEVYLLLDNVSATKEKKLPERIDAAVFAAPEGKDHEDWIQRISEIHYPPQDRPKRPLAEQAAELYRVRDALNLAAAPATSATIAFSLLYAGDQRTSNRIDAERDETGWLPGIVPAGLRRMFNRTAQLLDEQVEDGQMWEQFLRNRLSRDKLAGLAFPAFVRPARQLRLFTNWLLIFLISVLAFTTFLSWSAATGAALLTRIDTLTAERADIGKGMEEQRAKEIIQQRTATEAQGAEPAPPSIEMQAFQTKWTDNARQLAVARLNLDWWLQNGLVQNLARLGNPKNDIAATQSGPRPRNTPPQSDPGKVNVQWATVLLTVMANNILPILYGVLGAGAAVMRNLAAAMRDYLLSPRHLRMALIQLVLGALTGAVIGLFVSHDTASPGAPDGLLQGVFLSTSALCFVAGFGVEGVFQALESLVARVFNLNGPANRPPAQ
ncbi:hypothetical protein [Novosphingobium cyanobacteriorum]|uniref:Uncharacterized protein n=1 Tax=Novosphingobium cyanobacteriorum TaxID=3024215 RepID=A0ABT6CF73_9SPHN|nr:hypothetical protein [Novosphingobium cyanobacteriorum]MDF8332138.1 hypothetical protein [Novosphingobium cyanobacteriorum]